MVRDTYGTAFREDKFAAGRVERKVWNGLGENKFKILENIIEIRDSAYAPNYIKIVSIKISSWNRLFRHLPNKTVKLLSTQSSQIVISFRKSYTVSSLVIHAN